MSSGPRPTRGEPVKSSAALTDMFPEVVCLTESQDVEQIESLMKEVRDIYWLRSLAVHQGVIERSKKT